MRLEPGRLKNLQDFIENSQKQIGAISIPLKIQRNNINITYSPKYIYCCIVSSILAKDKVQYVRFPIRIWTKPICVFWQRPVEQHRRGLSRKIICWMFRKNCTFFPKLFWPTARKNVLVIERTFDIRGWRPRSCEIFEITKNNLFKQ